MDYIIKCSICGTEFKDEHLNDRCPKCSSADLTE